MKSKIVLTMDVEFSTHKEDMGVFGNIAGKSYGVPLFLEIARKHNIKITFFVDVYNVKEIYKKRYITICEQMIDEGHEVQLHTHPDGLFDKNRAYLGLYSLDEQADIIRTGKELLREWLGVTPRAHRAGDWSANSDTLRALSLNEIKIDSSAFWEYPSCGLRRSENDFCSGGIVEIPPSTYNINGLKVFKKRKLLSTDGNPWGEFTYVLRELMRREPAVINLVYHSFSFLKWSNRRTVYSFSAQEIEKFEKLLCFIEKSDELEPVLLTTITSCDNEESAQDVSAGCRFFMHRVVDKLLR